MDDLVAKSGRSWREANVGLFRCLQFQVLYWYRLWDPPFFWAKALEVLPKSIIAPIAPAPETSFLRDKVVGSFLDFESEFSEWGIFNRGYSEC